MDICCFFSILLLWKRCLWTFVYKPFVNHVFFFLGLISRISIVGHVLKVCFENFHKTVVWGHSDKKCVDMNQKTVIGSGGGLFDKSTCCTSLWTWVQILSTYIKIWTWPYASITSTILQCRDMRITGVWAPGSVGDCLKWIRRRAKIRTPNLLLWSLCMGHMPTYAQVHTYTCTCAYMHHSF